MDDAGSDDGLDTGAVTVWGRGIPPPHLGKFSTCVFWWGVHNSINMRHIPMCGFVGVTTECNMPSFLLIIPLNHMPPSLSMNIFVSSPTAVIFLISISIEDWHAIPSL